ncbi:hypothetical protein D5F01_LYC24501 [Larimichthys crocea]|uniref:Uncharacterized protein n=1 Tax=Larimichthys crocea TaxID=215358 RepID=A0A6G0HE81_LARCR|nr:hypothetical protein D5F01_LYC24501 [Larimichthys crocea]
MAALLPCLHFGTKRHLNRQVEAGGGRWREAAGHCLDTVQWLHCPAASCKQTLQQADMKTPLLASSAPDAPGPCPAARGGPVIGIIGSGDSQLCPSARGLRFQGGGGQPRPSRVTIGCSRWGGAAIAGGEAVDGSGGGWCSSRLPRALSTWWG